MIAVRGFRAMEVPWVSDGRGIRVCTCELYCIECIALCIVWVNVNEGEEDVG